MPKSLASRLSSPQELLSRLSSPSIISSDQDLEGFTERHFKRHGHLSVQEQITHALEDDKADRRRRRNRYQKTLPLLPRQKPLPPSIPATRPLRPDPPKPRAPTPPPPPADPLDTCFPPLIYRIAPPLPVFARKNTVDTLAIIETKINAVVKRIQALFDRKCLLEGSPGDQALALQRVGDKLEWILDHIKHEGSTWSYTHQRDIDRFCHAFAQIHFVGLKRNFRRILKAVAELESHGYLDWIELNV